MFLSILMLILPLNHRIPVFCYIASFSVHASSELRLPVRVSYTIFWLYAYLLYNSRFQWVIWKKRIINNTHRLLILLHTSSSTTLVITASTRESDFPTTRPSNGDTMSPFVSDNSHNCHNHEDGRGYRCEGKDSQPCYVTGHGTELRALLSQSQSSLSSLSWTKAAS